MAKRVSVPWAVGRIVLPGRFPSVAASATNRTITLALVHDPRERLYGAGDLDRDRSGSLLHLSGTQIVGNSVTRLPFLWFISGWSALFANDTAEIS